MLRGASAAEQAGCPKSLGPDVGNAARRGKRRRDEAGTTSLRLISVPMGSGGRDAHDPC